MLRCARCLGGSTRQDLATARCRWRPSPLVVPARDAIAQARRYISSGDLDRELGKLLGTSSDSLKGGKNPGNLVPGKNKWIKSKKQPRSFELDVGGLAGLAKTKDASGGGVGGGKQSTPTGQQDRRRADGNEGRAYGNGKGRDIRSNGQNQRHGQGHGQGQPRSQGHHQGQGQGARFGMKRETTGPGGEPGNRNFDRQSGPSSSTPTPRKLKNNKESGSSNGIGISSTETINAEADAEEPVVVEEDEDTTASRKNRFGPSSSKSGSSSGSGSFEGKGKGDKKSHAKSRTSFHKLSSGEPAYPAQPGSNSNTHGKRKNPNDLPTSLSSANSANANSNTNPKQKTVKKDKDKPEPKFKVEREVYIPPISVKVGDLARMVDVRLGNLQQRMRRMGMSEEECHSDNYLMSEDASLVVMEFGMNPIVDEERSFDIYPDPPEADASTLPLRPPVVTIMGHVDHGKTTLLDSLRHTSVASGEAGGITQHIGAFSVPLASLVNSESLSEGGVKSITFLDTPGHAAFTGMRARGASVTDIVVLVVAADDGVMPQTKEVLELVKKSGVGLVVAINKCDKPGVDFERVKGALGAEQIHLEEDGGDVPSVKVSGLKGQGLDTLVETLGVLAEVRDLRASVEGRGEGWVLESRVERGRGNSATILVTRGTLHVGSVIIAGTTWCKIRQMLDDKNRPIKSAPPGTPVNITGWKELPLAGDKILQPYDYGVGKGNKGEDEVKRAVANRIRDKERKALMNDVEVINEKRRMERERQVEEEARHEAIKAEGGDVSAAIRSEERRLKREEEERGKKELRLIIRADVSGTVEAVVGALEGIGNNEVGVKIIHTDVGDVSDSDVAMAEASDATIIGFSVKAPRSIETLASSKNIPLYTESVIYRLIELVRTKVAGLLPPIIETRVNGEATVLQVFTIAVKGQKEGQVVAGCRVGNGVVGKGDVVRVLRGEGREVVFEGPLESLRHLKKEINEARKGSECGMVVDGFKDVKEGDQIVSITKVEKAQQL